MNTISPKIVEQTWTEMNSTSASETPKIVERMSKEQPVILAYLMAAGHEILNQDERQLLLYLGVLVWQMMSRGNKSLPPVSDDILEEIEDKNFDMLEYLEGETETDFFATVATIIENYNQPEVLRYVVEALMEEDGEAVAIQKENAGMMMIYLKTVIDCFDR